jgi:hypothetical protein
VAANKLQGYLKPVAQTVYVLPEKRADLLRKWAPTYRLRPDVEGEIEVLDAFWEFEEVAGREALAPPLLVYADLLGTLDPRNREVAEQLQGLLGR